MLCGDTMRRRTRAQKGFVFTNLALATWLIASAWIITVPAAAAWMLTAIGVLLLAFTGYNAFVVEQGLPPVRKASAVVQILAVGVLLVPVVQPVSLLAMANAIVVGCVLFALSGTNWSGLTPTETLAARSG